MVFISKIYYYNFMKKNSDLARIMRNNPTKQEYKVWQLLKNKNIHDLKFRRQYPIGNYIVDFICLSKKVILEIDGGQHNEPEKILYDKTRTEYLEYRGFKVIRIWNNDVDNNIEGVYEMLNDALK